ncbi:hypothetical protein [Streptosporangium sp. NPDC051022]|uniref:hypothetical protein n=1 Tax=Streptosporangium sp. NPDC051022 TaxID=3155752 RepID=UPI003442F1CE
MWFLDRTARQLRLNPALLTYRPTDPARLESLLRQYDPGLTVTGDWFTTWDTRLRRAEITEEQAALARVPADRRGAIIACGGERTVSRHLLAGLACRLGGTLHPPGAWEERVRLEVHMDGHLRLGCERVAGLVRPILGERTVHHGHDLRLCHIEGRRGDPILVTYEYPPACSSGHRLGQGLGQRLGHALGYRSALSPSGGTVRDSGHVVGLSIETRDPHRSDMEVLYRAALAVSSATGGGIYSMDFLVTRFEDVLPVKDHPVR